jgi:glucose-6-phosphate 1-dehydrogenase
MQKPKNHIIVIFGASGDLSRRKLIPALYKLYKQDLMSEKFSILGLGRTELSDESFRNEMQNSFSQLFDNKELNPLFTQNMYYNPLNYDQLDSYHMLKDRIHKWQEDLEGNADVLFYLATPPGLYGTIAEMLAIAGLNESHCKIVIEKPFGTDLASARALNKKILSFFKEEQVYRIDHYLGKETVQNILVTRFSNIIFEPLWNRNYIHRVEITSAESLGVEKRGGYYDNSGALRDMVQNHLLQLVGLVAMEPPVMADSNSIRNETLKVFQSIRPLSRENIKKNVIRGQYTDNKINGKDLSAYREEEGVPSKSKTETYAAIKFYIDNWRWNGVPFYLRSGKRLPTRVTEIVIHFRSTPHHIFCDSAGNPTVANQLIIRIQPDEGILLKFGLKVPGAGFTVQNVNMDFHYKDLADINLPEAYERLLLDCMLNDPTLYSRGDAVENTWMFIDPILKAWKEDMDIPLYGYPSGTWGPSNADDLIEGDNITWRYPCKNLSNDGLYCEL